MTDDWEALGSDGLDYLEKRLQALVNLSLTDFDQKGRGVLVREWKVALAELMLSKFREGDVYAAAPFGPDFRSVNDVTNEEFGQAVDLVLDSFFGHRSRFAIIGSDFLNEEEPGFRRSLEEVPDYIHIFTHDSAVYGVLKLDVDVKVNRGRFEELRGLLSTGAVPLVFRGNEEFDGVCDGSWETPQLDDQAIQVLARNATDILISGPISGMYMIWSRSWDRGLATRWT